MVIKTNKELTPVSRDYTINLHRTCHGIQFKKKAPKAIKVIKAFAQDNMLTDEVRIDGKLNKFVWNKGIRNIPRRVRVRLSRKKDDKDESGNSFFTLAELIEVESFKDLKTEVSK